MDGWDISQTTTSPRAPLAVPIIVEFIGIQVLATLALLFQGSISGYRNQGLAWCSKYFAPRDVDSIVGHRNQWLGWCLNWT